MADLRTVNLGQPVVKEARLSRGEDTDLVVTMTGGYLCGYFCQECGEFNADAIELEHTVTVDVFESVFKKRGIQPDQEQEARERWEKRYGTLREKVNDRRELQYFRGRKQCAKCQCEQAWAGVKLPRFVRIIQVLVVIAAMSVGIAMMPLIGDTAWNSAWESSWSLSKADDASILCVIIGLAVSIACGIVIAIIISRRYYKMLNEQVGEQMNRQQLWNSFPYIYRPGDRLDPRDERLVRLNAIAKAMMTKAEA